MPSFTRTSPLPISPPDTLSSLPIPDLLISCPGSSSPPLPAHRLVLASSSPFLHSLLPPSPSCCPPTLILPNVAPNLLPPLLHLLYTGQSSPLTQQDKDSFLDLARSLGLPDLWSRGELSSWPDSSFSESSEYLSAGDQTANSVLGHDEMVTDEKVGGDAIEKVPRENLCRVVDDKGGESSTSTNISDEQIVNTLANLSLQTKVNNSNTFCQPDLFSSESESEDLIVKDGNKCDVDKEEYEISEPSAGVGCGVTDETSLKDNEVNVILENEVEYSEFNYEVEASNGKETPEKTNTLAESSVSFNGIDNSGTEDTRKTKNGNPTEEYEISKDSLEKNVKIKNCFVRVEKSKTNNDEQQCLEEERVDKSDQVDMSEEAESSCDSDEDSEECSEVSDKSDDDDFDDDDDSDSSDDNYEPELSKNNLSDSDCSDGGVVPCSCRGSCVRNCSCRTAGSRCTPSCSCLPQRCRLQTPAKWEIPAVHYDRESLKCPPFSIATADLECDEETESAPSDLLVPDQEAPLLSDSAISLSAVDSSQRKVLAPIMEKNLTPIMEKNTTITSISTTKKKRKKLYTESVGPQELEDM